MFWFLACKILFLNTSLPTTVFQEETTALEQLIEIQEKQIEIQKKLKGLMFAFKEQKDLFIRGNQTKQHTLRMIQTADQILKLISSSHLEHLFSLEYLEELALFTSIGRKHG